MTVNEIMKQDLENYFEGKKFEVNEFNEVNVWVREVGNPTAYKWDKVTKTVMKHREGDKPVFDNCYSYNDMFKFIVQDIRMN